MKPTLVVNPVTDHNFVDTAERFVEAGATTVEALEARLRAEYPQSVVRARELSGEAITVWYVYRDGHWTNARSNGSAQGGTDR